MKVVVLDAPSNLGLRPGPGGVISGVDRLAATVRAAGLLDKLRDAGAEVTDAGVVLAPAYDISGWEPGHGPYNAAAVADFTVELADRVESVGSTLLVLGGDCSILLGPALALARTGTPGLVFVDAHGDFRHPGNAPHVDALAGEELAVVTGRGGHALTDLEGRGPLIDDSRVAVLGLHDPDEWGHDELRATFPTVMTVDELRAVTPVTAAGHAVDAVLAAGATDVWVHVDVDVLDPEFLPAVDSPTPGGLDPDELVALLRPLLAHPSVRGVDLCIYDPALDKPDLPGATLLADLLARAFA